MTENCRSRLSRRSFLSSVAIAAVSATAGTAFARSVSGSLPWQADASDPPTAISMSGWQFFQPHEAATVEAIVDRLVPPDELSIGGKDAGCAQFIDRQLAGAFGSSSRLYTAGPFLVGLPTQGYQGEATPAQRYRSGLAAINRYLLENKANVFANLSQDEQDDFLKGMEEGRIELSGGVNGKQFFSLLLSNTMEGFFGDPVYGGNKDMASWKMLGFPGARYDYRDYVSKHNQPYPFAPVSIFGAPEWNAQLGSMK